MQKEKREEKKRVSPFVIVDVRARTVGACVKEYVASGARWVG